MRPHRQADNSQADQHHERYVAAGDRNDVVCARRLQPLGDGDGETGAVANENGRDHGRRQRIDGRDQAASLSSHVGSSSGGRLIPPRTRRDIDERRALDGAGYGEATPERLPTRAGTAGISPGVKTPEQDGCAQTAPAGPVFEHGPDQ